MANADRVVADTADHPIVRMHPDVVKAVVAAEYPSSGPGSSCALAMLTVYFDRSFYVVGDVEKAKPARYFPMRRIFVSG